MEPVLGSMDCMKEEVLSEGSDVNAGPWIGPCACMPKLAPTRAVPAFCEPPATTRAFDARNTALLTDGMGAEFKGRRRIGLLGDGDSESVDA